MIGRRFAAVSFVFVAAAGCAAPRPPEASTPAPPPDPRIRALAEILRAEDRRVVDDPLLARLGDADPAIRAKAVRAVGRIGDPTVRARIEQASTDGQPSVRAAAALALGLLGEPAGEATLVALANDADPSVRARAVEGIGRVGATHATVVTAGLADPIAAVRFEAALAAWKLRDPAPALDPLIALLRDGDGAVRFAAAYALARLGSAPYAAPSSGAAVARLAEDDLRRIRAAVAELVTDPEAEVRMQVARALTKPDTPAERAALGTLAGDRDVRVRINTLRALSYPGAPLEPYLKRALLERDRRVLRTVVEGLGRVGGGEAEKVLRDGIRGAGVRHPWVLEAAHASLAQVVPGLRGEVAAMLAASDDDTLRAGAGPLLAGVEDPRAVELATRLALDPSPRVAAGAIPIASQAPGAIAGVLTSAAASADPVVRAAVAEACGRRIGDEGAIALLETLWAAAAADPIPDARLEVVAAALKAEDDPRAKALVEAARHSPDWLVRKRAGAAGPASDRPIEDYEALVRWAQTPHAVAIVVQRGDLPAGGFTVQLDADEAPLASWNFWQLASKGFYDGLVVHRVVPNFVVQDGDPRGDGWGGPGYAIRDEYGAAHFDAGALGMASDGKDTAGSQWFVTVSAQPHLDGRYTVFGRVGLHFAEVLSRIEPGDRVVRMIPYEGRAAEPPPSLTNAAP
ncbi:MAG TPA: HEAT repeat domain-containing protein [Candidatus Polarisedimenticolaceae bacterium]